MRYRSVAVLTLVMALAAVPGAARAHEDGAGPARLAGHTFDFFGDPISVCMTATGNGLRWSALSSAADGSWAITVPPGVYTVRASEIIYLRDQPRCPFNGHTSWRFQSQSRSVNTLTETGSIDFYLRYLAGGGVWGDVCCIKSAAKPGSTVDVYLQLHVGIADRITAYWRDEESGIEYEVPRIPNFWKEPYGHAGFSRSYVVPADRPDGVYTGTFRVEADDGSEPAPSWSVTTIVESTAPEILQTYPAEGSVVSTELGPWVQATDTGGAGVADAWTTVEIKDLTTDTTLPLVWDSSNSRGKIIFRRLPDLVEGHEYEATFRLRDHSNNRTERTVRFRAEEQPVLDRFAPTDVVTDPLTPIEAYVDESIDPIRTFMRIEHQSGWGTLGWEPVQHDPVTGRVWVQPVDDGYPDPGEMLPLIPGVYTVELRASEYNYYTDTHTHTWTFVVRP